MFTGTHKRALYMLVIFSLALSACSSAARAGYKNTAAPQENKLPSPTLVQPVPTDTVTAPAAPHATFGDGVLLYEWRERPDLSLLHLIDPQTGVDIPGYAPISLGVSYAYAVSPDRNTLAVVIYPSNNSPIGGRLNLIDLQTWQVVTTTVKIDQWNTQMAFSPDNQKLAITTSQNRGASDKGKAVLVDIARRAEVAQAKTDFLPTHIKFTSDSGALIIYGSASWELSYQPASPAQTVLLSLPGLEVAWSFTLSDILDGFVPNEGAQTTGASSAPGPGEGRWMQPAVVFAPDKDNLYIVHADEDRLTTVDFTNRKVQAEDIRPPMSLLDRLMALTAGVAYAKTPDGNFKSAAISPDGQRLYILAKDIVTTKNTRSGEWETSQTPLGLKVARTSDGAELAHFDTQASDIAISADGNVLYLRSWSSSSHASAPFTEIWDTPQLKMLRVLDGHYLTPARQLNGKPILLSNNLYRGQIIQATLDAQTYTPLHQWTDPFYGDWLIIP